MHILKHMSSGRPQTKTTIIIFKNRQGKNVFNTIFSFVSFLSVLLQSVRVFHLIVSIRRKKLKTCSSYIWCQGSVLGNLYLCGKPWPDTAHVSDVLTWNNLRGSRTISHSIEERKTTRMTLIKILICIRYEIGVGVEVGCIMAGRGSIKRCPSVDNLKRTFILSFTNRIQESQLISLKVIHSFQQYLCCLYATLKLFNHKTVQLFVLNWTPSRHFLPGALLWKQFVKHTNSKQ